MVTWWVRWNPYLRCWFYTGLETFEQLTTDHFISSCSVPNRPGQGGYGRPGKASVFHKDGSPMG